MGSCIKGSLVVLGVIIGLVIGLVVTPSVKQSAWAEEGAAVPAACPRHTVIVTDGLHIVVTDNKTDVTYFYAMDEGEKPGADLKLRGSLDLKQVGQPVIKPTLFKKKTE
jgi:hypothetical protein